MKRTMIILICGVVITSLIAVTYYVMVHVLPYSAISPSRMTAEKLMVRFPEYSRAEDYGFTPKQFSFFTRDSLRLSGWIVDNHSTKGTVIVLHGISSCKEMMVPVIKRYSSAGFNVVAYDARAHGSSMGDYCTLGYYEKYDVSSCISAVESLIGKSVPYSIHGNSMGGAVALQAMAVEPRLKAGVIESSFANLRETMYDYMEDFMFVRWKWFAEPVFKRSEQIAQFSINEVSPEASVRSITQPVLLVHGDKDEKISIQYAHRNYQALGSAKKELYIIEGGGHFNLPKIAGAELDSHEVSWLKSVLTQ
jgi:uncharacterized protein